MTYKRELPYICERTLVCTLVAGVDQLTFCRVRKITRLDNTDFEFETACHWHVGTWIAVAVAEVLPSTCSNIR